MTLALLPKLLEHLLCLQCHGATLELQGGGADLVCSRCNAEFPALGRVPAVVHQPKRQRETWQAQQSGMVFTLGQALSKIEHDLKRFDLLPKTRSRLECLRAGIRKNQKGLVQLFKEAGLPLDADPPSRNPSEAPVPLTEHYQLLLRDWGWPKTKENERAAAQVLASFGARARVERMAVLGAGGGRLTYDLHRALKPALSVAIDNNPLLLLAADQVLGGGKLALQEFPLVPNTLADCAVERMLQLPGPVPNGLHVLLADALLPPLRAGAFDFILTPWFIDVVGEDIRDQVALIHNLLPVGGVWLNHGPLIHRGGQQPRMRYVADEVWELVERGGFELTCVEQQTCEHLVGPSTGQARLETVHTFAAVKRPLHAVDDEQDPPNWVLLPHVPVPNFHGLAGFKRATEHQGREQGPAQHPTIQRAVHLIDEQRSVDNIAAVLLSEGLLPANVAPLEAVSAILLSVYTSCRQQHDEHRDSSS